MGEGNTQDFVVFKNPRLEFVADDFEPPQTLLLKDVRKLAGRIEQTLAAELPRTGDYLKAAREMADSNESAQSVAKRSTRGSSRALRLARRLE